VAVRQQALTVVAPVRKDARETLSARLDEAESDVQDALVGVKSLHFARFVLIDGADGPKSRLAFESNHDGELGPHLEVLARVLAPFEDLLFGAWEGYRKGELAGFVEKHALPASTFYLGHPGLSVEQILDDRAVRLELERLLDIEVASSTSSSSSALVLRTKLVGALAKKELAVGPVDRGLPPQPISNIHFYAIVLFVIIPLAFVFIPIALLVEWRERREEPPRELVAEDDPRLDPINRREDAIAQNGLTHHVPLRGGPFRRTTLRLVLWFLENARRKIAYEGTLGGITSIHFARWVLLDDETVLFFSNYDGSWEAYPLVSVTASCSRGWPVRHVRAPRARAAPTMTRFPPASSCSGIRTPTRSSRLRLSARTASTSARTAPTSCTGSSARTPRASGSACWIARCRAETREPPPSSPLRWWGDGRAARRS